MPTTTLTDRYVDAAMRTVPEDQRSDLADELRVSIDDQIDARVAEGEPREQAERSVIVELGDPELLAAQYTDRQLYLVGPRYYLDWWRLTKLLLWIVIPLAGLGVAIAHTLSGAGIGEVIGATVVALLNVAMHVFFWTVLIVVILERTGTRMRKPYEGAWKPEMLPEPRQRGAGFGDMVASLIFLVVAAAALLWDRFIGFVPTEPGLSFFNPDLWPWVFAGLFVLMALEAALSIAVYFVGRWTVPLAVLNAALALAVAVPALILLAQGELLNPDFFATTTPGADVGSILTVITGFVIAGIAVWDIIDVAAKARRGRIGRR
ncbi:permease prefix domain 1-containing protein [Microbacterium yannicii]|uniref:permease prefix domain 1-containing protein n=1 Tax=Microbacterium yannicii TaxID=671622 RepID=UPI0002D30D4C|nr:permease prefix domain 1-containing protein [Microbacterium yannicii]